MSWLSSSKGFPRELDCPLFCTAKSHTKLSQNFTFLTKRHSAVEMLQTRNQRSGCAACRKMPSQEPDAGKGFHIQLWNNQNWDIEKITRSIITRNVLIEFYQLFSKRTRLPTVLHSKISHKTSLSQPRDTLLWECCRPATRSLAVQRAARCHRRHSLVTSLSFAILIDAPQAATCDWSSF